METVVISGANRGIGLELTRRFAANNCRVFAGCRVPKQATQLSELSKDTDIDIRTLDVTSGDDVEALRAELDGQTVDILINNAGIMGSQRQTVSDMDYDSWLKAFEVNTLAPFRLATALKPSISRSSNPRIVTISSQMGSLNRKSKGSFAYRSSKAAVNKVMQVLAAELEADDIIVCPVHPGWVRTDMGGPEAEISVGESADGLFSLINNLTKDQSGRFWTWEGKEHDW